MHNINQWLVLRLAVDCQSQHIVDVNVNVNLRI